METGPSVNSNVVILQFVNHRLHLTLTKSDTDQPTQWRLPSTSVQIDETSLSSLEQRLRATIGLDNGDVSYREQLYTSEKIDSGSNQITISYLYLSKGTSWHKGSQLIGLFPISKLPKLTADDDAIVLYALDRLSSKAHYSSILSFLLPDKFSFRELQELFQLTTHQQVDRRNFRKKMLDLGVLKKHTPLKTITSNEADQFSFTNQGSLTIYDKPFIPGSQNAR